MEDNITLNMDDLVIHGSSYPVIRGLYCASFTNLRVLGRVVEKVITQLALGHSSFAYH